VALNSDIDRTLKVGLDGFLLRTAKVLGFEAPRQGNLYFLREWLGDENGGDHFLADAGVEAEVWQDDHQSDLIVLTPTSRRDPLAEWMNDKVRPIYHRYIGHRIKQRFREQSPYPMWEYRDETFTLIGNIICMLLSSLIPTVSIFALYFVQSLVRRLFIITSSSLIFSSVMTFIVQGRRCDIVSATTAFAAVQVVFVGSVNVFNVVEEKL